MAGSGSGPNWQAVNIVAGASSFSGSIYIPPQSETFGNDLDGNLTSDARWICKWDAENRLVRIETQPSVAAPAVGVPAKQIQFTYDYQGRLIRRQVFSGTYTPGSPATISWSGTPDGTAGADLLFLYDGFQCIAALKPDQTLYQAYVWGLDVSGAFGGGGVGALVMFRRTVGVNTETYFPTYDGNGNVTGLVKGDAGTVSARYEYGPFGHLLRVSGEPVALENPFRFSTKYHDDYSDLLHYGYRFYNSLSGRWLNRDSIEEQGGLNLYAHVGNDPVGTIDSDGRQSILLTPNPVTLAPRLAPILEPAIRAAPGAAETVTSSSGGAGTTINLSPKPIGPGLTPPIPLTSPQPNPQQNPTQHPQHGRTTKKAQPPFR